MSFFGNGICKSHDDGAHGVPAVVTAMPNLSTVMRSKFSLKLKFYRQNFVFLIETTPGLFL